MRLVATYLVGLVFGTGIAISGMMNPAKVLNFFDFAGSWDPSLAFVMAGAVIVTFLGYRIVLARPRPLFEPAFSVPSSRVIDARLVGGAAVFGVGWGIAGFCPGGAIPALGTLDPRVFVFVAAMAGGMFFARWLQGRMARRSLAARGMQGA